MTINNITVKYSVVFRTEFELAKNNTVRFLNLFAIYVSPPPPTYHIHIQKFSQSCAI